VVLNSWAIISTEISSFSPETITILNPTGQSMDLEVLHGVGFQIIFSLSTFTVAEAWLRDFTGHRIVYCERGTCRRHGSRPKSRSRGPGSFRFRWSALGPEFLRCLSSFGGSFSGVLPGWNSGPLVAASTGLVLNITSPPSGGSTITLSQQSLTDITHLVDSNGNVNVSFTSQQEGVENRIFATYLKHEHYPEVQRQDTLVTDVPQSPITTWSRMDSMW
jgi:hypothetical protein